MRPRVMGYTTELSPAGRDHIVPFNALSHHVCERGSMYVEVYVADIGGEALVYVH